MNWSCYILFLIYPWLHEYPLLVKNFLEDKRFTETIKIEQYKLKKPFAESARVMRPEEGVLAPITLPQPDFSCSKYCPTLDTEDKVY